MENQPIENQPMGNGLQASQGMIIGGYVCLIFCGLASLVIGLMLMLSKENGVPKYNEASRKHGKTMLIILAVLFVLGIILNVAVAAMGGM